MQGESGKGKKAGNFYRRNKITRLNIIFFLLGIALTAFVLTAFLEDRVGHIPYI